MRNLFLASTAMFLATSGAAPAGEAGSALPSAKEIQAVTIEYDHPREHTVQFQAKPEDWSAIRATLTPAKRDPHPAKWENVGTVHLITKDGRPLNVYLYRPSPSPGTASAGKSPKQRDDSKQLINALNKAYQYAQKTE